MYTSQVASRLFSSLSFRESLPGIVLVGLVAAAAFGMRGLPAFATVSPMMGAILIGIVFGNTVGVPENARIGIAMCGKRLLRLAVALLGFQVTIWQVAAIGFAGLAATATILVLTFAFTLGLGRLLGIDRGLTMLVAAGTSVCGASAIAAMNDVAKAKDEDVSYAIAAITLFGTLAMFLYPLLIDAFRLSAEGFGFWTGVSVHEVAQVVAAAFQGGEAAGETGVAVKLARVMMLAPLILGVGALLGGRGPAVPASAGAKRAPLPVFVIGFIGCMLLNSFLDIPELVRGSIVGATPILLTASLGAIGLGTNIGRLRQHGMRPFLLTAMATLFIAAAGLAAVQFWLDV